MKKPNFFIVGAAKCGTTSLAHWLSQHRQIYVSPIKEPHHFDSDSPLGIKDRREYEKLFAGANSQHQAVGEASVRYIRSSVAVQNIVRYAPDARLIIMVRNPLEMAPSLHEQYVFGLNETIEDFEEAWRAQEKRSRGDDIPAGCRDPEGLLYGRQCKLGAQLQAVLSHVDEDRCKVIFLEDVQRDVRQVYIDTLSFLGVPDDGRTAFERKNSSKAIRHKPLTYAMKLALKAKPLLGLRHRQFGIANRIAEWNRVERPRQKLRPEMLLEMRDYFAEDIALLEQLTKRDLQHWLQV